MKSSHEFLTSFLMELQNKNDKINGFLSKKNFDTKKTNDLVNNEFSSRKNHVWEQTQSFLNNIQSMFSDYNSELAKIDIQECCVAMHEILEVYGDSKVSLYEASLCSQPKNQIPFRDITRVQHFSKEKTLQVEALVSESEEAFSEAKNIFLQLYKLEGVNNHFDILNKYNDLCKKIEASMCKFVTETPHEISKLITESKFKISSINKIYSDSVQEEIDTLIKDYAPDKIRKMYFSAPSQSNNDDYRCETTIPTKLLLGNLFIFCEKWSLNQTVIDVLQKHYSFLSSKLMTKKMLTIPNQIIFDDSFNLLIDTSPTDREIVSDRLRSIAMHLLLGFPPNKINFLFFDPIKLGDTFSIFNRITNENDKTNKIINGKIWSSPNDIEDKLRVMTDHIANITQKCLQGQYESIYDYNINAEPYQMLMIMDYPAGFTKNALTLLEQIITTGHKCGVYTIIVKSTEQISKITNNECLSIIKNIDSIVNTASWQDGVIKYNKRTDTDLNSSSLGVSIAWDVPPLLSSDELNKVIPVIKAGIKNAEHTIIEFKKIIPDKSQWFTGDSSNDLSIPIGVHGANKIQYLNLGIGGNYHALIAGQTGSGKSSLLHTIVMSSLIKYPADQLQIFLVDFKRGVEFKIYADYPINNFRVIAIESEKEFGCSVLEYLDLEQSRRAEKFKRFNVDNLNDYRVKSGETMPRLLLIVDEFHVLFSKDGNDECAKKSAVYLEQIIRQGRAFGLHVILSSQTMTSAGGISNGVWGQVGIRIALKCPKNDARIVLGSDNDGVDLLSADNPGQAIYNSDCGNVVANTVFRTAYITQKEQDNYLKYIASNTPKSDQFEPRVMLSNIEDNIYSPMQRFINGQTINFAENSFMIGEPLKLINKMKMTFRAKYNSNMLVIGRNEQRSRTLFIFSVLSAVLHTISINDYAKITSPNIYLFDFAPEEDIFEKDMLFELAEMLPDYVKYVTDEDSDEYLAELYKTFIQRETSNDSKEDMYMFIYGLQRARNLRSNSIYKNNFVDDEFDEFGLGTQPQLTAKPYEMFFNLIQRGAKVNINTLIWEDNFKTFMTHYNDLLPYFDMRVAFQMPNDDSTNFIEEPEGSKLAENTAIFSYKGNVMFRPYNKPDFYWLKKICDKINSFN